MDYNMVIASLKSQVNPANVTSMGRFGISAQNTLGISVYVLRKMARDLKNDLETRAVNHVVAFLLATLFVHYRDQAGTVHGDQ